MVLVFARLIHTNPSEIVELLSETSVDNRISLKVVLDKWLLQQPLFRGSYTRTVTLSALQKLLMMRDSRIESLMVIGYNPSHSNINSEVNAPFKILSTLLRFVDTESKGHANGSPQKGRKMGYGADEEGKEDGTFGGYQMKRNLFGKSGNGERLDTMEGYNDLYGDEEEDEDDDVGADDFDQMRDDSDSDGLDLEAEDGGRKKSKKRGLDTSQEKIEVNLDDIEDEDDQECLLGYKQNEYNSGQAPKIDQGLLANNNKKAQTESPLDPNLFKIKESQDKGLADMETGSEVYMSELLAGFDMEDFDEADEQNEEDLMLLGDEFAQISNLKDHILAQFNDFMTNTNQGKEYMAYCINQLHDEDQKMA